jgi:hypothetical protein
MLDSLPLISHGRNSGKCTHKQFEDTMNRAVRPHPRRSSAPLPPDDPSKDYNEGDKTTTDPNPKPKTRPRVNQPLFASNKCLVERESSARPED